MARVLIFGTFDGIHAGHESLFAQARALGNEVIVGVARDEHVRILKDKQPRIDEATRLAAIRARDEVDEAFLCDAELGSFGIMEVVQPDVVLLGYDQEALHEELDRWIRARGFVAPIRRATKYETC